MIEYFISNISIFIVSIFFIVTTSIECVNKKKKKQKEKERKRAKSRDRDRARRIQKRKTEVKTAIVPKPTNCVTKEEKKPIAVDANEVTATAELRNVDPPRSDADRPEVEGSLKKEDKSDTDEESCVIPKETDATPKQPSTTDAQLPKDINLDDLTRCRDQTPQIILDAKNLFDLL